VQRNNVDRFKSNRKNIAIHPGFLAIKGTLYANSPALFQTILPLRGPRGAAFLCSGADKPENVVLQYHFIGATQLASNTNRCRRRQSLRAKIPPSTLKIWFSTDWPGILAESLHFQTNKGADALLRPLLESVLLSESMASVSGSSGHPLDFVLAINLDPRSRADLAAILEDHK